MSIRSGRSSNPSVVRRASASVRTLGIGAPSGTHAEPQSIAELRNLGPKSEQMLCACGVVSVEQLRKLGAVAAYAKVKATQKSASLNLLWALEGALTGLSWQEVAREHRTSLLLSLEQLQNGG